MSVDEIAECADIEDEEQYHIKARYIRKVYGKCPAQRELNGNYYCSRMIPCEQYSDDSLVSVKEPGQKEYKCYNKCKFIERFFELLKKAA